MPRLILLRHGQSVWNRDAIFTGWTDVDLCDNGIEEAKQAAALLKEHNIKFDECFASYLQRSVHTLWLVLDALELTWLPVHRSWRLNERHYGALQGRKRDEVMEEVGCSKSQFDTALKNLQISMNIVRMNDPEAEHDTWVPFRELYLDVWNRYVEDD